MPAAARRRAAVPADPVLEGLRVVEVGQYVAAPLAATIFADLGADVVKVERPGGDPQRADAARFAAWNRGKQTVELDLHDATRTPRARRAAGRRRRPGREPATRLARAPARPPPEPRPTPPGHLLHQCLGQRRPVTRRPRLGAAGPGPGRRPAGPLHRRRPDLDALPRRQRRRRAPGRHRHRRRAGQARVDRLRPARRDLAARCAALPQRRTDLPPRGPAAQGDPPAQLGHPAPLRHGRRPLR